VLVVKSLRFIANSECSNYSCTDGSSTLPIHVKSYFPKFITIHVKNSILRYTYNTIELFCQRVENRVLYNNKPKNRNDEIRLKELNNTRLSKKELRILKSSIQNKKTV
jgi:hypothetical protein